MEIGGTNNTSELLLDNSGVLEDLIENSINNENPITSSIIDICVNFITGNIRTLLIAILFFYRIITLIRVIKDSNARSNSFSFQFFSGVLIICLTPIIGLPLYISIRPQGWKWDKTPRRDEAFQNMQLCENCGHICHITHAYCTDCGESLQISCRECHKKYSKSYAYCPICGAPQLDV